MPLTELLGQLKMLIASRSSVNSTQSSQTVVLPHSDLANHTILKEIQFSQAEQTFSQRGHAFIQFPQRRKQRVGPRRSLEVLFFSFLEKIACLATTSHPKSSQPVWSQVEPALCPGSPGSTDGQTEVVWQLTCGVL